MAKKRLSIKKLTVVVIGFILILSLIFKLGGSVIKKIKIDLIESKKIILNEDSQKRYKIFIDPGHGGNDVGTVNNYYNDSYEKQIAFEISTKIVDKLSNYSNVDIVVSRFEDRYISLENRVKHANDVDADYFIAIHLNADPNTEETYGIETYYSESNKKEIDGSDELAKKIQNNIIEVTKTKDRGVKKSDFMVTKFTKMPAVLIECGFLTNKNEQEKIMTQMYQEKIAQGVVDGLVEYIEQK